MKLIDKDAVVAEIKRYKHKADERLKIKGRTLAEDCKDSALQNLCGNLLHFLDTIEVKGVDLEEKATKLSQKYFPDEENIWARPNIEAQRCKSACIEMVEWLKAQKGESYV